MKGRMGAWPLLALLLAAPVAAEERPEVKAQQQTIEQKLNDWDIAGARQDVVELEKLVPMHVETLLYYKGRVAFEEGRYEEAVKLLSAAGVEDKSGSYLRLARDTLKITKDDKKAESEHFIFFYPAGKDEILAPYALETLESIRSALAKDLGHSPPGKVRVEVVNDARELSKVSTLTYEQIKTTGTIAICKFNKLMVTSPKAVLRGYDWQDTLAHEYTHLVVTEKSRNTVPIWLHEGMAKYLESRWRGPAGLSMMPSMLALLGTRVKQDKLVPFEKMHPSIAMLPTADDAATAFAEVFFAVDMIYREHGTQGLQTIIQKLATGETDKRAVEAATGLPFPAFEKAWLAYVKKQAFPAEPLPTEKVVLKDQAPADAKKKEEKKGREIGFGDFVEVEEPEARKMAHLGELMRERGRAIAAAEEYGKAYQKVGDKYESLSNKYALALLEIRRIDEAEKVLLGSLKMHPGSASTQVHLGRIYLAREDYSKARAAYLDALSSDPFDEEIHFALLRINEALGDKALADRARKAACLLTGRPPEEVEEVAKKFGKQGKDLADVELPAGPTDGKGAPAAKGAGKPDAGTPAPGKPGTPAPGKPGTPARGKPDAGR